MKLRHVLLAVIVGALAIGAGAAWAQADHLVIAQSTDATSLDPAFRGDTATGNVVGHIFDPVMLRTADMTIEPWLAESVEQLTDTSWRVTFRDGISFSNGEPLDAAAVKYSLDRILDPGLQSPIRGWFTIFSSVEAVDTHVLEITTAQPDPLFEARMSLLFPVPPGHVEEVGQARFSQQPVGTGPYRLVSWNRDDSVVLERNEVYWGESPAFERVTFRVVPEELSRVFALQTGEADVVVAVSPEQAAALENAGDVRVAMSPSTRVMVLGFDTDYAPADDPAFRRAVAHAVDRRAIVEDLLGGYVGSVTSIFGPGVPGWPQDTDYAYPFDPDRARELVAEHGFGDTEIVLRTPSDRYPYDRDTAMAVGQMLQDVGLDVVVRPQEWGTFFEDLQRGDMSPVYVMGHGNVWIDPFPQLDAFLHSEGFLSTWSDPEVDALLAASNEARGAEREAIFGEALQKLHDDVAVVPLFAQASLYGVNARIDWQPRIDDIIRVQEMDLTAD
jgi:peptide/nickel transport system substrate-binding protein